MPLLQPLCIADCSASSILNGDEESFGAANMLDGADDTCWNSDGGEHQVLTLTLQAPCAALRALELVFQGGFVGQDMRVAGLPGAEGAGEGAEASAAELGRFQPQDCNERQRFALAPSAFPVHRVRVSFTGSTDFYGRVVIYCAQLLEEG